MDEKTWFYLTLPFRPRYWLMNYQYSEAWDRRLKKLMDEHEFQPKRSHTCRLNGETVWVSNHPYASFRPYDGNYGMLGVRPSRWTIYKARQKLERDLINKG